MSTESTDGLLRAIIATKTKKIREHMDIAKRARESADAHLAAAAKLEDEIRDLREGLGKR